MLSSVYCGGNRALVGEDRDEPGADRRRDPQDRARRPTAGWATSAAGLILLTLLQVVIIALLFSMGVLNTRAVAEVIPLRDCPYFIEGVKHLELPS